jgi:hypothetical protein
MTPYNLHDGTGRVWVVLADSPDAALADRSWGRAVLAREARLCAVCGHTICPFCGDWCDVLCGDDDDVCCGMQCAVIQGPLREAGDSAADARTDSSWFRAVREAMGL